VSNKIENNLTDQHLIDQVLSGNTNAFGIIIKKTEGLVAQIIFKMINNVDDRKDIAQDVYLKTFNKLSDFKFQSKLSTWIAQITYNTCLSYLEKKKLFFPDNIFPENESADDALELMSAKSMNSFNNETETLISHKELSVILKSEIEKLSPVYKTLITLFHNQELSYQEISKITELPEGTVKNYLFRARRTLKENLLLQYKKEEL
jgi:RNA polymerase sigma factor (sigma-70 family)